MNADSSYGRNNWAAFNGVLKGFNIAYKGIAEQWPKAGTMDLTSHVAPLKAAKPDLIFSSLLFADLPIFMNQAHAAGLTAATTSSFQVLRFQHPLNTKEVITPCIFFGLHSL